MKSKNIISILLALIMVSGLTSVIGSASSVAIPTKITNSKTGETITGTYNASSKTVTYTSTAKETDYTPVIDAYSTLCSGDKYDKNLQILDIDALNCISMSLSKPVAGGMVDHIDLKEKYDGETVTDRYDFTRDQNGRVIRCDYGNQYQGRYVEFRLDKDGHITSYTLQPFHGPQGITTFVSSNGTISSIKSKEDLEDAGISITETVTNDSNGRPTDLYEDGVKIRSYKYDSSGNLISISDFSGDTTYTTNYTYKNNLLSTIQNPVMDGTYTIVWTNL